MTDTPPLSWSARALRWYAYTVVGATLVLIFLGGQVKSHEAGLAVPDWPLTYGQNPITYPLSEWKGGIFHEHFHRLVAGTVATLTVLLAVWLQLAEPRRWLRRMGWLALGAVLTQAVLGGMTVWYKLPVAVSSAHGILAQTFLVCLIVIAYGLSHERRMRVSNLPAGGAEARTPLVPLALLAIGCIYVQLFLGALMRHTESGLAVPDFPTMAGQWIPSVSDDAVAWVNDWRLEHSFQTGVDLPPVDATQMLTNLLHRGGAVFVLAAVYTLAWAAWKRRREYARAWHTAALLAGLVTLQASLGILTLWTARLPLITSLHVATGAALLGLCVLLTLRVWPLGATVAAPEKDRALPQGAHPAGLR